jgi:hypothetical protein
MESQRLDPPGLLPSSGAAVISATADSPELAATATVRERAAGIRSARREAGAGGGDRAWQKRLLPVMVGLLVALTAFFFIASCMQLYYLQSRIDRAPQLDLSAALASLDEIGKDLQNAKLGDQLAFNNRLQFARWKTLALLEANALQRRYHQSGVLLISRIWTRYLGFVTGTILAMVGAAFILGKLQEASSNLGAEGGFGKLSLTTASPGLVLATLGTMLMLATLATNMDLQVNDGPVYLREQIAPVEGPPPPLAPDRAAKPRSDVDILKDLKASGEDKK